MADGGLPAPQPPPVVPPVQPDVPPAQLIVPPAQPSPVKVKSKVPSFNWSHFKAEFVG